MRQLRSFIATLIAICALSALPATSANATAHITYSGNGVFTIASGAGHWRFQPSGVEFSCKGDTGTGHLNGGQASGGARTATTAELTISFTGCKFAGEDCTSKGGAVGLMDTTKLIATLGDVNKTTVGLLLKPAIGTAFLASVQCEAEGTLEAAGSLIGQFDTATDKQTKTLELAFEEEGAGTSGTQKIKHFEGETQINHLSIKLGSRVLESGILVSTETLSLAEGSGQLLP